MKNIILASQSPRRKELLELCGYPFTCEPADIDETMDSTKPIQDEILRVSRMKAEKILESHPDCIVIGSDTSVVLDHQVMGKPVDDEDAFSMIHSLQGKVHQVMTGLVVLTNDYVYEHMEICDVQFTEMDDEEIWKYIHTG